MSQSTDALIWWGVSLGDDEEVGERIREIINGDPGNESVYLYGDGREWLAEHALLGKVEFVEHCSSSYPMYGLAVFGTVRTARRGSPVGLDLPPAQADDSLLRAITALGVEVPIDEFGWKLASWAEM